MATNSCDLPAKAVDPRILGPTRTSFEQLPLSQQLQYTFLPPGRTWQAFMGWCNFWLERAGLPVLSDLSDFGNGAVLSSLLEILSGKPVPDIGSTKDHVANLESCFAFMRRENVLLLHIIQPQDIHDGKLTSVFALIWALIVYYGIVRPLSYEEAAPSELHGPISLATAEKLLARRVNLFLTHDGRAGKKGKKKRKEAATLRAALFNYATALESGSLFSSLIAKVKPRLLTAKGDGGKERKRRDVGAVLALDSALDILRRKWGLPAFFAERDYALCLREKKPVLAYVTLCLHALRPAPSPPPSEPNNNASGVSSSSSRSAVMTFVGTNSGVMSSSALLAVVDSAAGRELVEDIKLRRSNSTGLPSSRSGVHPLSAAVAIAASSDSKSQAAAGAGTANEGSRKRSLSEVLRRSALGLLNRAIAMADDKQPPPQEPPQEQQQPQVQVQRTEEAGASQVVEPPRPAKKQKARKRRPKTLDDRPRRRKKDKEAASKAELEEKPATESKRETLADSQASTQQEQPPTSTANCQGVATNDAVASSPSIVTEQLPQPSADGGGSEKPSTESGSGAKKKTKKSKQRRELKEAKASTKEERKLRRGKDPVGNDSVEATPVIETAIDSAAKEDGPTPKESGGLTVSGLLRKKDRKEKGVEGNKKAEKKRKKGSKLMNLITRPRGKSRADTLEAGWVEHAARAASLVAQDDAAAAPPEVEALSCIAAIGHTSSDGNIGSVDVGGGEGGGGGGGSGSFTQKLEALARVLLDQRPMTQTESLHKKRFEEMETTIEQVAALVRAELDVWQKLRLAAARDNVAPTPAILDQASYEGSVRRALQELVVAQREVKRVVAISPLISSGSSLHPLWKQVLDCLQQLVNEIKADAGTASLRRRRDKGAPIPTISLMSYSPVGETVDSSNGAGDNQRGNGVVAHKSGGEMGAEGRQQPSRTLSASNNSTTGDQPFARNGSTTGGGGERAGGVLLRLRSFNSADDASKRSAAVVPRAPNSYKPAREAKAKPTIVRSSTSDIERTPSGPPSGNGAQGSSASTSENLDRDRDRFWRSVRSANSNKKTPNGPEEPLVVTLCKQNIRASLQLLQSDVLSTPSADTPPVRDVGQGKAALNGEATHLLTDMEGVEGVLDKLFLGFSSVDSLKTHSLVDLTDFSKLIYDLVCLLKGVERAFRRSLLDFSLRSLGTDSNLARDKLAERNAGNLTIWKAIMRDSGSLLEETVLVLDSIRQNNVVKTMRLNAWQNLREKVALQVNRLKLDFKKDVTWSSSTYNSRSDASSEQDIMRMVEKEIAGLEVEVREEKQAAAEQEEATSSAIASDLLLAAEEGSSASSYTEMTSLLLGSPPDESVVSSTQQSENEQQMNEIFDFLHKKLADSGLARSRMSLPVAMPTMPPPACSPAPITDALEPEPTLPAPSSASGVAVFHTIPDVADLPPPPEEDDGADYYDVDEQPENQKMNNIFSKLQHKLANEGIKTIPPTPRFVSSAEQAVVTELVGSGECEDLQPLCAQATLPSPPLIEMLPSPRLMALSLRRGLAGSSSGLAAVSTHLYHARLLPSRQQEQADADAIAGPRPPPSARGGRLDMCARCARHIADDQPRLLALGRVYHQPCLTCTGCGRLLEREFHTKEEATYCSECTRSPGTQPRQSSSSLPPSPPDFAP